MKSKRGYKMAIAGLIVGLLVGIGIITSKEWLKREIIDALDDEVRAACDCTLTFDSLDISYLTLSASVSNPRILEKGVSKLSFQRIHAKVSLEEITSKRVLLTKVDLLGGVADGAGPDSVMFRFVDHLTKSTPPELDRPGRWKVKLIALELFSTKLTEPLRGGSIEANGVTMMANRMGDRFILKPRIGSLALRLNSSEDASKYREIDLGSASTTVALDDEVTRFRGLSLGRSGNAFQTDGTTLSNSDETLTGPVQFALGFDYLDVPKWLRGRFLGTGDFSGTIGNPKITGTFKAEEFDAPYVTLGSFSFGRFPDMLGKLFVDLNHGHPYVEITGLEGSNETFSVSSTSPLHISAESMRGTVGLTSERFEISGVVANDLDVAISFDGASGGVVTDISTTVRKLEIFGQDFGPVKSTAQFKNDVLTFNVTSQATNRVAFSGSFTFPEIGDALLHDGKLELKGFPIYHQENAERQPTLDAQLSVSGPWNLLGIQSTGQISLATPSAVGPFVAGTLNLKDGKVSVSMADPSSAVKTESLFDLLGSSGTLNVSMESASIASMLPSVSCGSVSGSLNYKFSLSNPLLGDGHLKLSKFTSGCEPYELGLTNPSDIPVTDGSFNLSNIGFKGFHTEMTLNGAISFLDGYDLTALGSLQLGSLISYISSAEDLRGSLTANVKVTGPLEAPELHGEASFKDGGIAFDSPEVNLHDINGTLLLKGSEISISTLSGELNGGDFEVSGFIVPFDIPRSRIETHLKNIQISPLEDANLVFSGDLSLIASESGRPTLTGTVVFDEGDFKKDLNPNRLIIQAVGGFLFPGRTIEENASGASLPDIDLDLRLKASRNLFVTTTFFGTELTADIAVTGNMRSPSVSGSMRALRGWVGLKGNRFEITSGQVEFKPEAIEPSLEIVAEGNVRSTTGENILVIVEASGPLRSPKIALSSDRGLSHDELLLLITSNSSLLGRSQVKMVADEFDDFNEPIFSSGPFSGLRTLFKNLTQIDTLAFEPIYSPYSGAVEPAIVAQKRLTERLALIGESTFGTIANSKAGLVYGLAPEVNISTTAESVSTRRNTALAVDLSVTVLTDRDKFAVITIFGTDEIDSKTVLQSLRLSESSRVRPDDVSAIEKSITALYSSRGFLNATANVLCETDGFFCRKIAIAVAEGSLSKISAVRFLGDDIKVALGSGYQPPAVIGDAAEQTVLDSVQSTLLRAVRSEGYLGARITTRYVPFEGAANVALQITVTLEQPLTFVFNGNTLFTPEDFLNSIELFKRKRPFGNNTIKVLVQNIERMYRDAGYFYVVVNVLESENAGRIVYEVNITEDIKAVPGTVSFEGNHTLSEREILNLVRSYDLANPETIVAPKAIVPDQLETMKSALTQVYIEEGFPAVRVDYRLQPNDSGSNIDVVYSITEGERIRALTLNVRGLPSGVTEPSLPPGSISIPKINRYISSVIDAVRNAGFLYPAVTVDYNASSSALNISVTTGPSTTVEEIQVGGLSRIDESVVRKYLALKPGDPWTVDKVNATRRDLLKLGVFSRVDIAPADGVLDSEREKMVIRVYERALQTLDLGVGANSEFGLHLFGEAIDKSVFSDGRSLALRLDTYLDQNTVNDGSQAGPDISQGFASLRYLDPDFANSEYSFSEELRLQRQDLSTQEFDQDRVSLATYWYRQFASGINVTGGHTLLFDNLDDVSPDAILGDLDSGTVRLGFLSASVGVDRRDDPLIPRSGYTLRLDPKLAADVFGSQGNYATLVGRATAIVPLDDLAQRFSLGFGFSAGGSWTYGDTEDVPITQRFYLGGRTTVRGFRENSLGPKGSAGSVIGGDRLLAGSSQLQYLVSDALSVHTFLDSGSVFLRDDGFYVSDLRWSTGVGMRYLSPIGPIGFDVGHPLDEKQGEPSLRVHFSVGSNF